jgi:outer membrane protein
MKNLILLAIFLFLSVPHSVYAEEYSLEDLYRLALDRSETIKIAEEDLYISQQDRSKARAVFFPTLSAFGYHTRFSEEKSQDDVLLQPENTSEWGLRLNQTFSLSGREFTAYKIAGNAIIKSEFDLRAVKEEYLFDVATQYYTVLRAKRGLEISGANVERLKKHRDAARIRLEVGEVTKTVLLRAEAELAGAQSELIKSENNLQITLTRLAKTVGIRGGYVIKEPVERKDVQTPEEIFSAMDISVNDCKLPMADCLKEIAMTERAEIKALTIQKQIAEDEVKYKKGSYWPSLSLEGEYFRQENEPDTAFGLEERIYGGVKLDFPFFEGGLRRAEVREAKARLRQAELGLSDLKNEIGVEVENTYLAIKREAALIKQVEAEMAFARENYKSVTKQFEYGIADSIDTIDANTLLVTSERDMVNAKFIYQLALLRLKRATGTLLEMIQDQRHSALTEIPVDN